jgi:two-component system, chemotaxis family, CheB/CheR fusion protein
MIKDSASLDDFSAAFLGRLRAMATTHELLSRGNWTGAGLKELASAALQSHLGKDSHAIGLNGPDLLLTPNAAATLGLVFYELATNAAKYGSLSADGRVDIDWRVDRNPGGDRLAIEWSETGGPAIDGPIEEGFGTGFIKRSTEYELNGTADLQLGPAGLRWTLTFPLQRNIQQQSNPSQSGNN